MSDESVSDAPRLRLARPEDAAAVRDIYAPFVRETPATFTLEPPSVSDLREKIRTTREDDEYPWYVAEDPSAGDRTASGPDAEGGGSILGYAYATPVRDRPAYQWSVETSIYVDPTNHRGGVGRRLYDRLFDTLRKQGYVSAYAVLGLPNPESEAFHEAYGFDHLADFPAAGYKLGAWRDVGWHRLELRTPPENPGPPRPVSAVAPESDEF